ncbi:MAG: hypothetical protein ACJA2O_004184 [Candidatus Azotimanducaceae bacterium]|jgi:hypothetical protein
MDKFTVRLMVTISVDCTIDMPSQIHPVSIVLWIYIKTCLTLYGFSLNDECKGFFISTYTMACPIGFLSTNDFARLFSSGCQSAFFTDSIPSSSQYRMIFFDKFKVCLCWWHITFTKID